MKNWLATLMVFNGLDVITTLTAIYLGLKEANPLMQFFLEISPVAFVTVKAALMIPLILIWDMKTSSNFQWFLKLITVGYVITVIWNTFNCILVAL